MTVTTTFVQDCSSLVLLLSNSLFELRKFTVLVYIFAPTYHFLLPCFFLEDEGLSFGQELQEEFSFQSAGTVYEVYNWFIFQTLENVRMRLYTAINRAELSF